MELNYECLHIIEFSKVQKDIIDNLIPVETIDRSNKIVEFIGNSSKILRETYCRTRCIRYPYCSVLKNLREKH